MTRLIGIFSIVVEMSIYTAFVITILLIVRLILKRKLPAWFSYALWGIVLIRLLLPVGLLSSHISFFNLEQPLRAVSQIQNIPKTSDIQSLINNTAITETQSPPLSNAASTPSTPAETPANVLIPALSLIWLAGVIIFLLFTAFAHMVTIHRLRFAVNFNKSELLHECAGKVSLRRQVKLSLCDAFATPVVCGVLRPRIVLPSSMENVNDDTLRAVLIHELSHIKRYDLLANLIGILAMSFHWFNPFVWIAASVSHRDRERSCDERTLAILGNNKHYAETLLTISTIQNHIRVHTGVLAFGEEGVKGRIRSALNFKKKGRWIIVVSFMLFVALAVTLITTATPDNVSNPAATDNNISDNSKPTANNAIDCTQYLHVGSSLPEAVKKFGSSDFGATLMKCVYSNSKRIILHNESYLLTLRYTGNQWIIDSSLELIPIDCSRMQGDITTMFYVTNEGNTINMQNTNIENKNLPPLYVYDIQNQKVTKYDNVKIPQPKVDTASEYKPEYKMINLKKLAVFDQNGKTIREIPVENGTGFFRYVDNDTLVDVAFPKSDYGQVNFYAHCRLVFYNLRTGKVWDQLIVEGYQF